MNTVCRLIICFILAVCGGGSCAGIDVTFAVWSDTHFGAYDFNDPTRLEIVDQINRMGEGPLPEDLANKPDFLIHCGDITEKGTPGQWDDPNAADQRSYVQTIARLEPRIKAFATLGNHDSRKGENIREAFAAMYGATYYSFDRGGVHFALLDPYPEMNSAAPTLDKGQLEWLAADLAKQSPKMPVIIVMHILPMCDEALDRTSRLDRASSDALTATLADKNVIAFLHGHWHARSMKEWNGIPVLAPAGFAYYRKGCAGGQPVIGVIRVTDAAFSVWGYDWEKRAFEEKPYYSQPYSRIFMGKMPVLRP